MVKINGMDFVNDENVIGKWENIGWTEEKDSLSIENLHSKSGDFDDLYFLPNGKPYWIFEGWTKGTLFLHYGGLSPVIPYNYATKDIDGKKYLFLRLDDKTEVFIKVNDTIYEKHILGRHDNVDLPFVMDEKVIGKWESVACVSKMEDFSSNINKDDLCLKSMEFLPDGTLIHTYLDEKWDNKWTKGLALNLKRTTAGAYQIKEIDGVEYLFVEWKMGNYIYGGKDPDYYVFKRSGSNR